MTVTDNVMNDKRHLSPPRPPRCPRPEQLLVLCDGGLRELPGEPGCHHGATREGHGDAGRHEERSQHGRIEGASAPRMWGPGPLRQRRDAAGAALVGDNDVFADDRGPVFLPAPGGHCRPAARCRYADEPLLGGPGLSGLGDLHRGAVEVHEHPPAQWLPEPDVDQSKVAFGCDRRP